MGRKRLKIGNLNASAVVFDQPSKHGLRNGRVSKLTIRTKGGKIVANYDRGWDIRPKKKSHQDAVNQVLKEYPTKKPKLRRTKKKNPRKRR